MNFEQFLAPKSSTSKVLRLVIVFKYSYISAAVFFLSSTVRCAPGTSSLPSPLLHRSSAPIGAARCRPCALGRIQRLRATTCSNVSQQNRFLVQTQQRRCLAVGANRRSALDEPGARVFRPTVADCWRCCGPGKNRGKTTTCYARRQCAKKRSTWTGVAHNTHFPGCCCSAR